MEDILPLLPDKPGAVCGDVRGVLREVFRVASAGRASAGRASVGEAAGVEWALVQGRARQLAGAGQADAASPGPPPPAPLGGRPAGGGGNATAATDKHRQQQLPPIPNMKCCSHTHRPTRDACVAQLPQSAPAVVCVPDQVEFRNYSVGGEYQAEVRVVNVCGRRVRLSVVPPARGELAARWSRGGGLAGGWLLVGEARRLRVTFRPHSRRALTDWLLVHDSLGHTLRVPVLCHLQPPLLEVTVLGPAVEGMVEVAGAVRCGAGGEVELGARLLGDTHYAQLVLRCPDRHATFFLVDEESWLCGEAGGAADCSVGGSWAVRPRGWAGGGAARGAVWARCGRAGLLLGALRLLGGCTARPLLLLADALLHRRDHVTLRAHHRRYDICGDGDDACDNYLDLGTTAPNQTISATIEIINHSAVTYSYYWIFREWGECWCTHPGVPSNVLCDHAEKQMKDMSTSEGLALPTDGQLIDDKSKKEKKEESKSSRERARWNMTLSHEEGELRPRSSTLVTVSVMNDLPVGENRTVLMLVLKNIPVESIPPECEMDVVSRSRVLREEMPGAGGGGRVVAALVAAQLEARWRVCAPRAALWPPALRLCSSRAARLPLQLRAELLGPGAPSPARWGLPAPHTPHPPLQLHAARPVAATLHLTLPHLPDELPASDVISLGCDDPSGTWVARCVVERRSTVRHPRLCSSRSWRGVVSPCDPVVHSLTLTNDTLQEITWHAEMYRWWDGVKPVACEGAACGACQQRDCGCGWLRPAGGGMAAGERAQLQCCEQAPRDEGCVAALVLARRGAPPRVGPPPPPAAGRASLTAYRTLYTRLALQVLPCRELGAEPCAQCVCEERAPAPLLRVCGLTAGGTRARRVRLRCLTPLPATGRWLPPPVEDDLFEVKFIPNEFRVEGHGHTEVTVEVTARGVANPRVCVRAASVSNACAPLYLLLVLSATGIEVDVEFPPPTVCRMRVHQKETPLRNTACALRTDAQIFADEDKRRAKITKNICRCPQSWQYIEPTSRPLPDRQIPIIEEPPPVSRVCGCGVWAGGARVGGWGTPCLQVVGAGRGEVRRAVLRLVARSSRPVKWRAELRHCGAPEGLAAQVKPSHGELRGAGAGGAASVSVRVCGSAWGVYREQLLLVIEELEPLVLDVWVQVTGGPLHPALLPPPPAPCRPLLATRTTCPNPDIANVRMSGREPRGVCVTNVSSCAISVYPYLTRELENEHRVLPFRLYVRLYEALLADCPCMQQLEEVSEGTGVGVELYLAADIGVQDDSYYEVSPDCLQLPGGGRGVFQVRCTRAAPPHCLLLRCAALSQAGGWCWRPEAPALLLRLRAADALPHLVAPVRTYVARVSGITLSTRQTLTLRKEVRLYNAGDGRVECIARVSAPWRLVDGVGGEGARQVPLCVSARGAARVCVAARLRATDLCPATEAGAGGGGGGGAHYPPRLLLRSSLEVWERRAVLETVSLLVEVELPRLQLKPEHVELGFVCDGDVRRTYVTVSHTGRSDALEVEVCWEGAAEWEVAPRRLAVPAGAMRRVWLQYTARWRGGAAAGGALRAVAAGGGGGGQHWCRAATTATATATRDHRWRTHDHHQCPLETLETEINAPSL